MSPIRAVLVAAFAVVLAVVAQPLTPAAQQSGKVWRVGLVSVAYMQIEEAFFQQLRDLGYIQGQNSSSSGAIPRDGRSDFQSWRPRSFDSIPT
jgi:hypothetical protein